jgi:hypothetical protein
LKKAKNFYENEIYFVPTLTGYVILVYAVNIVRKTTALFLGFDGIQTKGNFLFSLSGTSKAG